MLSLTQSTMFDLNDAKIFPLSELIVNAVDKLALNSAPESRGAIYTRIEVVEFILDLAGYTDDKQLFNKRILEPSFGGGDFLFPLIDRLLACWNGRKATSSIEALGNAIRAVELHKQTFDATREKVVSHLQSCGFSFSTATELADQWLVQGDFLLESITGSFDYIVGNPPYIRQELIPEALLAEYRHRFSTLYDRADIYVPFIERSLLLLKENGVFGFICSDRWMKNRYGGPLRNFISEGFHLRAFVDMVGTPAFHSEVSAYPAITIICKDKPSSTRIAHRPKIDRKKLKKLASEMISSNLQTKSRIREMNNVVNGFEPWLLEASDQLSLIRRIESQYPEMEQTGCKVGIGVATGADEAFIGEYQSLDVEEERKLPLVTTRDIQSGKIIWRGQGVINPFNEDGTLVKFEDFPRFAHYIESRRNVIASRHCARKNPTRWYRTIDRIWPELTVKPKLLIPDIKGEANVVYDSGRFYPHHNLYYVVSETWDLRALQAVLLSSITKLFISTYSTQMRGGYLRFQAQYLRRIRLPHWEDVSENLRQELIQAALLRNHIDCDKAVFKLYKLNCEEKSTVGGNGES